MLRGFQNRENGILGIITVSAKEAAVSFFEDAGTVYGLAVAEINQNVAYLPAVDL